MPEAQSSWNTLYQSKEGFECQITLRDEDEGALWQRVAEMMAAILNGGGTPAKRANFEGEGKPMPKEDPKPNGSSEKPEKTYLDEKGVRRCNLRLKNGQRCNTVVVEREGRYGRFWSCSNYKEHGP